MAATTAPRASHASGAEENFDSQEVDPFTSHLKLTPWMWFKSLLGSVFILPFRAVAVVLVLLSAWFWAKVGLIGHSGPNASPPPLVGWRRSLLDKYSYLGLLVFWAAGFVVRIKGEQAPPEEAPILVGAPHSSFLEAMLVVMCKCSPVSRIENKNAIVIAVIQKFLHTIFVDRCVAEFELFFPFVISRVDDSITQSILKFTFIFPQAQSGIPQEGCRRHQRARPRPLQVW